MKTLISIPHSFFLKRVSGLPLIVRMIRVLQQCGITDIYILSNILELNEGSIHILRTKEEVSQKLGEDYLLIDLPIVFDGDFLADLLANRKKEKHITIFSKLNLDNYKGVHFLLQNDKKDVKRAEKALRQSLRKPHDTFVSRNLNRPLSLQVSRFLVNTNISPNTITIFVFLIGVMASVSLIIRPDYWGGLIGGTLFHVASVLDGCDGEIARLKFKSSKFGFWLDTASDETTNFLFAGALGMFCASYFKDTLYLKAGLLAMGIFLLAKILQYFMILKGYQNEDISQYELGFEKEEKKGFAKLLSYVFAFGKNIARNDAFAILMMIAGIFGIMRWALAGVLLMSTALLVTVIVDFFSKVVLKKSKA